MSSQGDVSLNEYERSKYESVSVQGHNYELPRVAKGI